MSKRVFSGKTVNDAKNKGLLELGVTEQEVSITILEQPSRGLFGWFGAKEAKVEIELLPVLDQAAPSTENSELDAVEQSKMFLADILHHMGIVASIEQSSDEDGNLVFQVTGKDLGVFIGRRGQTLDAMQTLINVFANRFSDEYVRIILDAERFRERRKKTLQALSLRLANQVIRTKKEVVLEPMSSHERRIIHYHLQNHPKVKTFSKGVEPNRSIVIALKS